MKKLLVLFAVVLFTFSITSMAFAGDKAGCASKLKCTKPCLMSKIATDKKAGCVDSKGNVYEGKCADLSLAVVGMTCGGCEAKITKTLSEVDGVILVKSVSHTDSKAELCYNPEKISSEKLVAVVTDLGYKVEIAEDKVADAKVCSEKHASEETAHKCPQSSK